MDLGPLHSYNATLGGKFRCRVAPPPSIETAMRRAAVLITTIALGAVPGCGSSDERTPAACLDGPGAYSRALRSAPEAVRLRDDTAISSCLTRNQSAGDLTRVGAALVSAATTLNAEARGGGTAAAERLGYLIGAVQRGAEETGGIHANLVGRVEVSAEFSPGGAALPAPVQAAYLRGVAAGRGGG